MDTASLGSAAGWMLVVQRFEHLKERPQAQQFQFEKERKAPASSSGKDAVKKTGSGKVWPPATGKFPAAINKCRHTEVVCRGIGSQTWWTCKACGSRWERPHPEGEQRKPAPEADLGAGGSNASGDTAPRSRCGAQLVIRSNPETNQTFFRCKTVFLSASTP